jgi:hypothetical protein
MQRDFYPLLSQRPQEANPERWLEDSPAGIEMKKAAKSLAGEFDAFGHFFKATCTALAAGALGEIFGGAVFDFFEGQPLEALGPAAEASIQGMAAFASLSLLRADHKLLPLFLDPEVKFYSVTDCRQGRTVPPWGKALQFLLERHLGKGSVTVVLEGRPKALSSRFGGFDVLVAAKTLGHAIAIEIDEPCHHVDPSIRYHSRPEQKRQDDNKDAAAARIGLPVVRLAEQQLIDQPAAAMGLCLRFLEARTGLQLPSSVFGQYPWQQLRKVPRFTVESEPYPRVEYGWSPAF